MDAQTTYLLCPDRTCRLFFDTTRRTPCEHDCPLEKLLVKIIKCHNCGELIELEGNHNYLRRVDHACSGGRCAANFQRLSGTYQLIYERPRE